MRKYTANRNFFAASRNFFELHQTDSQIICSLFEITSFENGQINTTLSNNTQAIDGPTPEKALASNAEIEYPSRLSVVFQRYTGRFLSFRLLVVVVTVLWLGQSFTWGGLYLGCGLAVAVSVAALAGLIVKDYVSQGSIVSRCACVCCQLLLPTSLLFLLLPLSMLNERCFFSSREESCWPLARALWVNQHHCTAHS